MNKFLLLKNGVILTEHIRPVIIALDEYFEKANLTAYVTSGLRKPEDQLRIIRNELNSRGLSGDYQDAFEDIGFKMQYEGQEVYGWQPGWSRLLNLGFIVNPPYPAKCLMTYFRPGSPVNRKGQLIGDSPHTRGTAFDISGGNDGVINEAQVIEKAMGKVKGLKGYLIERNNNAIHVDVGPIDMTKLK
ncbi:MAG TPA: hypothetical protein VK589_25545 [Chryseolinea sp.]|nr:hypothetical protein [Chryseolinea sp.]